jgi:aldehyde oxidoreductase
MIEFSVNGIERRVDVSPTARLSDTLRNRLGLTGTKTGCDAGDCGACTVLVDGQQMCACLMPTARVQGLNVETVEGLANEDGQLNRLQYEFARAGAAQCGICTPGMLMAASSLLSCDPQPTAQAVHDALGGVLCRCTGYQHIVDAVMAAAHGSSDNDVRPLTPNVGEAVGARVAHFTATEKVTGAERFGADWAPDDVLSLRVIRSPHARATFKVGDLESFTKAHPGVVTVLSASDIPGANAFGIYPSLKDQPVLAAGEARYRGEAILALVGTHESVHGVLESDVPVTWTPSPATLDLNDARAVLHGPVQVRFPDNVLARGRLQRNDCATALKNAEFQTTTDVRTNYVEHAYIEPEAGWARKVGASVEITVSTQSPYMDRDECALILGIAPEQVRIIPTACGGGFGGKLDLSVQPLLAVAAWLLDKPVRLAYSRTESMMATTKRHPSAIQARAGCAADGHLLALEFEAHFNTGAYASWGPTVADRVPVHATGPYRIDAVTAHSIALLTNGPPAGAFRGFGVPQSALAIEALLDQLGAKCGLDPLQMRYKNALRCGDATATGQTLHASVGLVECLDAVAPAWHQWRADVAAFNETAQGPMRRGVGIGCMWYGCGNTSMSNPSTMRIALRRDGGVMLMSGAADIGQGVTTILLQIAADAIGIPLDQLGLVYGDTALTPDAGKSSASRQTYVSGRAAELAGQQFRGKLLRMTNAAPSARVVLEGGLVRVIDGPSSTDIDPALLKADADGNVIVSEGSFDPPTTPLDADGQGNPYGTYAFGVHIAEVEVDVATGQVRALRISAAHDVGRSINPLQVEGQIIGGVAQGLGLALMEEYVPGRTENLHDYLIPTIGDMPNVQVFQIEDPQPDGPSGAKGVGEPALIGTAPAIMGAIEQATGIRPAHLPVTPSRLRDALREHHP